MLSAYRLFLTIFTEVMRAPGSQQIVRNTCYTWLEKNRRSELMTEFNEEVHRQHPASPETIAAQADNRHRLMRALESLPARQREALVLREFEGLLDIEIAEITEIPIGTVISALAPAHEGSRQTLSTATVKRRL